MDQPTIEIIAIPAGPIATNAYVVGDPVTKRALAIDAPPGAAAEMLEAARQAGLSIELIVLTHHHWDHIVDTGELRAATGAPIAAHPDSVPDLATPAQPASMGIPLRVEPVSPDRLLRDGDTVEVGSLTFQVLHTPGHAPGQISLYSPARHVLFGGDTLFPGGYGRVDLPGSSMEQTITTMRRLLDLPDDVVVYSGHGPATTIGAERPWMTQLVRV